MEANWKQILGWIRVSETGHTDSETDPAHWGNGDDPDDSGGRTSRGITQREYNAYCAIAGLPQGDVYEAPNPVIDDIYHKAYWMPYGPVLPPGIDYVFADECVNAGPGEAAYLLQEGLIKLGFNLGPTGADRHIGMLTSAAVIKAKPTELIKAMSVVRVAIYKNIEARIPRDKKFDRGWMNRVTYCENNALTLVPKDGTASA